MEVKKEIIKGLLASALLLLWGCTLSMDEWVIPEEELGHDEPYTVETPYGEITYQFQDSVVFFSENLQQQYLVRVEADSILYINGSIPDEWRPYVGQKMATGISHALPYGLNNRVIDVQDQSGIYRVVTTRVPIKEVYKKLNYCLDSGLSTPSLAGLSEEELEDLGYELTIDTKTGDTIINDWNDYDIAHGLRPAEARRTSLKQVLEARRTRAEGDPQNGEEPKDGSKDGHKDDGLEEIERDMGEWGKDELFKVGWDTRKDIGDGRVVVGLAGDAGEKIAKIMETVVAGASAVNDIAVFGGTEKHKFYTAGSFTYIKYEKVHALRDEDREYEEEWTDTYSDIVGSFEFGLYKPGDATSKEIGKNFKDVVFNSKLAKATLDDMKKKSRIKGEGKWNNGKIRVILTVTPIPIAIVAGGKVEPIIDFSGFGSVSARYTSEVVRNGNITHDGIQDPIKNKIVKYEKIEPGFHFDGFCLNGSLELGLGASVFAGLEFAGTASVTVSIDLEAKFKGDCSFNVSKAIGDAINDKDSVMYNNFKGSFGFVTTIGANLNFEVAPLGLSIWEESINLKEITLYEVSFSCTPDIRGITGYQQKEMDGDAIIGLYSTGNLDSFAPWMLIDEYYAGMRCYFGPIEDGHYEYMAYANDLGELLEDVRERKTIDDWHDYYFVWKGSLAKKAEEIGKKIHEVHIVPVIYTLKGINLLYSGPVTFDNLKQYISTNGAIDLSNINVKVEAGDPEIITEAAGQLLAKESEANPGRREIKFYTKHHVWTGGLIKDWGVTVYLYDKDKKLIKTPSGANGRVVRPKNGKRSANYFFIFTFETSWSEYVTYGVDKEGNPITGRDMKLYYRVIPFWYVPTNSSESEYKYVKATDRNSKKYYELVFEMEENPRVIQSIKNNSKNYGTAITETDLGVR